MSEAYQSLTSQENTFGRGDMRSPRLVLELEQVRAYIRDQEDADGAGRF